MSRVTPVGFKSAQSGESLLKISKIDNMIQLSSPTINGHVETCHMDACCEYLDDDTNKEPQRFASQGEVYEKFHRWLNQRGDKSRSCVLVVGCSGSGKSHTLFGRNQYNERGIIPRYLEHVFSSPELMATIQMSVLENEQVRDMLDFPSVYPLKL